MVATIIAMKSAEHLALDIHRYMGSSSCFHDTHSSFKMCEGIAEYLVEEEIVGSGADFIDSLKTNKLVLDILRKQLQYAWDQGWVYGKTGGDIELNPYADK